jgi:predicted alpha/beta-hydrolase family hydrolase
MTQVRELDFPVNDKAGRVSAILVEPPGAQLVYVMAHGAGAGMRHAFLEDIASRLGERGVATLRYQFPYMEAGRNRTDTPAVATATVKAAVEAASEKMPGVPVIAGGKSFGGRMTSHAAAEGMLGGVIGLSFLGFPLHAPGRPSDSRAEHLVQVPVPMLFLQGTRDDFADLDLLRAVTDRMGDKATLHLVEGGDHSFKVPKRSGKTQDQVMEELAERIVEWSGLLAGNRRR